MTSCLYAHLPAREPRRRWFTKAPKHAPFAQRSRPALVKSDITLNVVGYAATPPTFSLHAHK
jgi:hypothetical protein